MLLPGHILLTDFGMSHQFETQQFTSKSLCGTPEYLAPEMINGKGHSFPVSRMGIGLLFLVENVGLPYHVDLLEWSRKRGGARSIREESKKENPDFFVDNFPEIFLEIPVLLQTSFHRSG